MLSKLWKYIAAAGVFLATILYALLQKSQADNARDKQDAAEAESEALNRQSEARNDQEAENQKREADILNSPVDRNHFSKPRQL